MRSQSGLALALIHPLALLLVCLLGVVGAADSIQVAFPSVVFGNAQGNPCHPPGGCVAKVVGPRCYSALRGPPLRSWWIAWLTAPLSLIGVAMHGRLRHGPCGREGPRSPTTAVCWSLLAESPLRPQSRKRGVGVRSRAGTRRRAYGRRRHVRLFLVGLLFLGRVSLVVGGLVLLLLLLVLRVVLLLARRILVRVAKRLPLSSVVVE